MKAEVEAGHETIASEFPPAAASVPDARRWARGWARQVGLPDSLVERLAVNVTELAANAVVHTRAPFRVGLSLNGARVRIEVIDTDDELPRPMHPPADALSGRGLAIVRALSSAAGVTHMPDRGKRVWAEIQA